MPCKYSPGHIPITKVRSRNHNPSSRSQRLFQVFLPATDSLAQIKYILLDCSNIEIGKVQKIRCIAPVIAPRSRSQVPNIAITHWTTRHNSHILLRHPPLGTPAYIAPHTNSESHTMPYNSWRPD